MCGPGLCCIASRQWQTKARDQGTRQSEAVQAVLQQVGLVECAAGPNAWCPHLSVRGLCSNVLSTTISVYSQVWRDSMRTSCRKCRSVHSILQESFHSWWLILCLLRGCQLTCTLITGAARR